MNTNYLPLKKKNSENNRKPNNSNLNWKKKKNPKNASKDKSNKNKELKILLTSILKPPLKFKNCKKKPKKKLNNQEATFTEKSKS